MKGKLLSLLLPLALLAGCAAPAGAYRLPAEVTDLSQPVEAGTPAPPAADGAADAAIGHLGGRLPRADRPPRPRAAVYWKRLVTPAEKPRSWGLLVASMTRISPMA